MKIGVLGIGKLGLCLALNLERSAHHVIGVDVSEEYVEQLNNKTFFSHEPGVNELLKASTNFKASVQIKDVLTDECEILFVMVATPSLANGSYDHSQIERVANELTGFGRRDKKIHFIIGATVMPGFCSQLQQKLQPFNYQVSYNPEFIAQGSIIENQIYCDQVLIGEASADAGDLLEEIYRNMCQSKPAICRMDLISAEICKIATNCFLTTKISFANSVGDLAIQAGGDPQKILAAIGADSRIGDKYLKYGFGFGGPCFPRDNRALNVFARQSGYNLLISEVVDKVNEQHLQFQVEDYMKHYALDETIVLQEVVYKKGTFILENSQQLALAVKLAEAGRKVLIREKRAVIDVLQKTYKGLFVHEDIEL